MPLISGLTSPNRVLVCDGAMGTMIHSKGVPIGQSFDEINISRAEIVAEIHREYIDAGADVIETNTFGANRLKLDAHGLGHRTRDINQAGARIARECAGADVLVAGSVGPTGRLMQPFGPLDFDTAVEVYTEQITSLAEGGCDLIIIETMQDLRETKAALLAAKTVTDIPVICQMSFGQEGKSMMGTPPEVAAVVLAGAGADLVGTNCGTGPQDMLSAVSAMADVVGVGLTAQPNAGLPRYYEGRLMYLSTPEYMADFARQFAEAGAVLVGGCCGTTPDHIKAIAAAVRNVPAAERFVPQGGYISGRMRLYGTGAGGPLLVGSALGGMSEPSSEVRSQDIQEFVEGQFDKGAAAVCLDCDGAEPARVVELAQSASHAAMCLTGSSTAVLEEALRAVEGRPLIMLRGSASDVISEALPLARRYGGVAFARADQVSGGAEQRLTAAMEIVRAAEDLGMRKTDLLIHAGRLCQEGQGSDVVIRTIRLIKSELGVPVAIEWPSGNFSGDEAASALSEALSAGADVLIADPYAAEVQAVLSEH